MKKKQSKYQVIDYVFWFLLIVWSNPGGILIALGEDKSKSGIDVQDYVVVLLLGCFIIIFHSLKMRDRIFKKALKYLFIFGLYYFIIFGFFVPVLKENSNYTFFSFLIKSRRTIYSLLFFVMIYSFYIRSYLIFYKTLVISSIIILSLFLFSFITGFEILPIERVNRGFVNIDRNFLASYGLMSLLIPMGAVLIVFKSDLKLKKLIIIGFVLMLLTFILSLTRRQIIAPFIYLFISLLVFNYLQRKELIPVRKIISILFFTILLGFFISLILPKYAKASVAGIDQTIHIIQYGETTSGKKDTRMGLGKDFMQNLIINNLWFGTGYHKNWSGSEGDKLGYEPSDYPFLSAIAMTGLFGVLIFLPIYVIIIKSIIYDLGFLRRNSVNFQSLEFYFLIMFIIYFIYHLLQYMNWFLPVSNTKQSSWYIYFAMYLASRRIFYNKYVNEKMVKG